MTINWYPGHMHKARREIKNALPEIDVVIEILDARLPFSSANPVLEKLARHKPTLKLLSKSDLADSEITAEWINFFNKQANTRALPIITNDLKTLQPIAQVCQQLASQVRESRSVKALVIGIPNVGKSSLINSLAGRKIAKVGNEPAVTRRQQKIQVGDKLQITDTPGVLWPRIENLNSSYRLAASGAIRDTAMDYEEVGLWTAESLLQRYPKALMARYKLKSLPENGALLLTEIAARRGGLRAGGLVDLHRASEVLLHDLRGGQLGRISLEKPVDIPLELTTLEEALSDSDETE
ncbi:MAG TPA: ribosome biogenesis GTPase YlqF [Marinospirillum sp.]|uniref:ribosome biogenesis GTPase YlqF n=1 Tax=Marinospirillum sp. TaxID=2183934 RepID=UPI002B45ABE2|nr:ribosome biogenesis GTPase YlqF [Marinospirillum sp.]HKM15306.1 ribosome biogenesis GTPase YlqF [Marinospirillum sp.]